MSDFLFSLVTLLKRMFMKNLFAMFVVMLPLRESIFYCAAGSGV